MKENLAPKKAIREFGKFMRKKRKRIVLRNEKPTVGNFTTCRHEKGIGFSKGDVSVALSIGEKRSYFKGGN